MSSDGQKTILELPTSKNRALTRRKLAFHLEGRCPEAFYPIFGFYIRRKKRLLAGAGQARSTGHTDFQIAGVLQVMVIGDKIRRLLRYRTTGLQRVQHES